MFKSIAFRIFSLIIICILTFTACSSKDNNINEKATTTQNNIKNDEISVIEYEKFLKSLNKDVVYFLITGVDLSENLTDIIMVACYDLANNKINILQIPRDTYVGDVTGGKINYVYGNPRDGESKIKSLIRCISSNFGLPINYYVSLNIEASEKIIDGIGGIDIKLDRSFTLADDSRKPEIKKSFSAGKVHLDGRWATAFLRHRKSFDQGDLGRLKNQRSIYAAILKQFKLLSVNELCNLTFESLNFIDTDIERNIAVSLALKSRILTSNDIFIYTLPGQTATVNNASCWVAHKQETVDLINEHFMPYEKEVKTVDDLTIKDYAEIGAAYNNSYGEFLTGGELEKFDNDKN